MSAVATETTQTAELQIELIPRPGTPERRQFEESGRLPVNYSDSSMELNWCLAPAVLERIKEEEAELYMLVVVESGGQEKNRQVVPFTKGYCQVMFPSVGVNTVHVTGVWSSYRDVQRYLLKKEGGRYYDVTVLEMRQPETDAIRREIEEHTRTLTSIRGDGTRAQRRRGAYQTRLEELHRKLKDVRSTEKNVPSIVDFQYVYRLETEAMDSVTVDATMFATHWRVTAWLASVYPYFKRHPSPDGCEDRKRAWVYTAPTIWAYAVYLLAKSVAGLGIFLFSAWAGFRDISLKPVYKPHGRWPTHVKGSSDSTFWWQKADGSDREFNPLTVLNPPLITLSGLLTAISTTIWARFCFPRKGWTEHFVNMWTAGPWWFYAVMVLGPMIVVVVVGAFVLLFGGVGYLTKSTPITSWRERRRTKRQERQKVRQEEYYSRAAELTCGTGQVLKKPAEKKPIYMRPLEAGKLRVCKPNPR